MSRRALVLSAALLAGCTGPGAPTATPPPQDRQACRELITALPQQVDGDDSSGASDYASAWGEPQIVLRCGVPRPAAYEKTSEMIAINGVAWFAEERDDGYTFTTVGRTPLVEVRVPDTHQPEVNPLVDLAAPIRRHTEVTGAAGYVS